MTQQANPKSGCFSAVVRRLLCAGSQQTHPSDNIPDPETLEPFEEPKKEPKPENESDQLQPSSSTITPNVVARLMGLESIPEANWVLSEKSPSSVTRSKSVNFMDYMLKIHEEEEEDEVRQCRRVKASVSFREVPCSRKNQQKRHDFLLLYLDKLDEKREIGSRSRRFEKGLEDSKQKKSDKGKNKEMMIVVNKKENNKKVSKKFKDEPRKVFKKSKKRGDLRAKKVRWFLSPCKSKETALIGKSGRNSESKNPVKQTEEAEADAKLTKNGSKRVAGKEDEPESSSENSNSSPVSVLDRDLYDYLILDDYSFSGDSDETLDLKSKTRSSPSKTKKKESNNKNNDEETEYIAKLMNMLAELSEEDMKGSTWVSSTKDPFDFDQVEDVCVDFGQEILDLVLDQLVDELCI